jgi:hypothetical protein
VRQDLEQVAALDHRDHLGEVPAHQRAGGLAAKQRAGVDQPSPAGQRVHGAEYPVESAGRQHCGGAARTERLASFRADKIRNEGKRCKLVQHER